MRVPIVIALAATVLSVFASGTASAAPGDLVTGWTGCGAAAGTACNGSNGLSGIVSSVRADADGTLRVAGIFTTYNSIPRGGSFLRFNADGVVPAGWPSGAGFDNYSMDSAVTDSGQIYVAGYFGAYEANARYFVSRLNSTGAFDSTWYGCAASTCTTNAGAYSGLSAYANAVAVSGGAPILTGSFQSFNAAGGAPVRSADGIVKLASNGIDPSWVCKGGLTYGTIGYALAVQADGKILVGGNFTDYGNRGTGSDNTCVSGNASARVTRSQIARLNADGSLDTSWTGCVNGSNAQVACSGSNGLGGGSATVRAIKIQPDGKILVGGSFTTFNGQTVGNIIRLNADGTLDPTFATTGTGLNGMVTTIDLHPSGRIFIGGTFSTYNGSTCRAVARLLVDGSHDTAFACSAAYLNGGLTGFLNSVAYQSTTGQLIVGGNFTTIGGTARSRIAALSGAGPPGSPTAVVGVAGDAQVRVSWTAPGSDGGSVITGYGVEVASGGGYAAATTSACSPASDTCRVVTGLTNGTAYTFRVSATNGAGTGSASAPSAAVTPVTTPGAPTGVVGVAGDAQVRVSWTAPGSDGGAVLTGYTVTGSPSGSCTTAGATTCTITGLANGTAYTFTVKATNVVGASAASSPSAAITPTAPASGAASGSSSGSGETAASTPAPTIRGMTQAGGTGIALRMRVQGAGVVRVRGVRLGRSLGVGGTVCIGSRIAAGGSTVVVECRLTTAARATLRLMPLRVRVTATFTAKGGGTASTSRLVRLRQIFPVPTPVPSVVTG
ncbi:MAG: fibronectin type III domain-containing protein [Thermoleophilia bacterium]